MRVLFIANLFPPGYTGGAEVINYHTCRGLMAEGIDCSLLVVNSRQSATADQRYVHGGIPVHRVTFQTPRRRAWRDVFDPRVYGAVQAELRSLRPDLVHIHNVSGASLAPYLACRPQGIPVVNTLHDLWLLCPNNMLYRRDGSFCDPGGSVPRGTGQVGRRRVGLRPMPGCGDCFRRYDYWGDIPYRRTVFSYLTSNVRAFISPSQALVDLHVRAGYDPVRFRVVPHGLKPTGRKTAYHPAIREIAADRARFQTLVFAGGGVEIKGAEVLLNAIPAMLAYVPHLRVLVAGGGEERLLARFRRFAPRVSVLGWVPFQDMGFLFSTADLVVVPSTCAENFPLVALESLQLGTPVVGSDLGGIGEMVADSQTGYLFPVGDAAALAERVILHFARPAYVRRQMRHQCVDRASTELSFERHIQGTLRVYEDVLSR